MEKVDNFMKWLQFISHFVKIWFMFTFVAIFFGVMFYSPSDLLTLVNMPIIYTINLFLPFLILSTTVSILFLIGEILA